MSVFLYLCCSVCVVASKLYGVDATIIIFVFVLFCIVLSKLLCLFYGVFAVVSEVVVSVLLFLCSGFCLLVSML